MTFIIKSLCNWCFWFPTNVSIWCLEWISLLLLVWRYRRFSYLINFTLFFIGNTLALIDFSRRTISILFNLKWFNLLILFNWRRSLCLNWSLCKRKRLRFYHGNNLTPSDFHFLRRISLCSFLFFPCALFLSFYCLMERSIYELNLLADLYWAVPESSHSQLLLVWIWGNTFFVRRHHFLWLGTSSRPLDTSSTLYLWSLCIKTCSRIQIYFLAWLIGSWLRLLWSYVYLVNWFL